MPCTPLERYQKESLASVTLYKYLITTRTEALLLSNTFLKTLQKPLLVIQVIMSRSNNHTIRMTNQWLKTKLYIFTRTIWSTPTHLMLDVFMTMTRWLFALSMTKVKELVLSQLTSLPERIIKLVKAWSITESTPTAEIPEVQLLLTTRVENLNSDLLDCIKEEADIVTLASFKDFHLDLHFWITVTSILPDLMKSRCLEGNLQRTRNHLKSSSTIKTARLSRINLKLQSKSNLKR